MPLSDQGIDRGDMPGPERRELIERIERLAYRAWPAVEVKSCDGWQLRFTYGVTHRANSVWPNGAGEALSLQQKIASAEAFYTRRERPAIFQLCPAAEPPRLDAHLEGRGYVQGRETAVQIAPVAGVLARVGGGRFPMTVGASCDDRWLAVYRETAGVEPDDARRRGEIMRRIQPVAAYAIAWNGNIPCAVGSAVCEDGWVGVFNMATVIAQRRQGAARAVVRGLAEWARNLGAIDMYLQVMRDNTAAWALYDRLGFETLYGYHYRSRAASHA
jgi:ribosomal protein S18 acetylase RimI-like enzyme